MCVCSCVRVYASVCVWVCVGVLMGVCVCVHVLNPKKQPRCWIDYLLLAPDFLGFLVFPVITTFMSDFSSLHLLGTYSIKFNWPVITDVICGLWHLNCIFIVFNPVIMFAL